MNDWMELKTGTNVCGVTREYMKMGLVKGRNLLKKHGFIQCQNPLYYTKAGVYTHYSRLQGIWILEEVQS